MRNEKVIPGIVLVLIGTIFLLDNYNVIDFHWSNLIHLWPIFLIMGGVNLVFANNRSAWATVLKISVVVLGFSLLVFSHFENRYFFPNYNFHYNDRANDMDDDDDDDNDDNDKNTKGLVNVESSTTYSEPYVATAAQARLNISGGGTVYTLKDTTSQLFSANTTQFYNKYEYTHTLEGTTPVLNLKMRNRDNGHFEWDSEKTNKADIKLNVNPEWDINVEAGATKLDFDLSPFKVKYMKLSGGAASFEVKLGQPLATTNVEVSTGVSEVEIKVPQNAACEITSNSGLSSTNFDGFTKVNGNTYQTPGFANAANKMIIRMKGGVSDFKVTKY